MGKKEFFKPTLAKIIITSPGIILSIVTLILLSYCPPCPKIQGQIAYCAPCASLVIRMLTGNIISIFLIGINYMISCLMVYIWKRYKKINALILYFLIFLILFTLIYKIDLLIDNLFLLIIILLNLIPPLVFSVVLTAFIYNPKKHSKNKRNFIFIIAFIISSLIFFIIMFLISSAIMPELLFD